MDIRARALELLKTRKPDYSLPQAFYNDPALYELDLDVAFHRQWIFAGAECEVAKPGDYFTLTIGRSPIVVLRDRAGHLRAFFNTCRHRGSRICLAERGRAKVLVCPYHQWSYDLTGRLTHAGHMQDDLDLAEHSLIPVHLRTVGGTIYVCLADEAPDFGPYREVLEPYLAPHDLANAKLAHEAHLVERGNWKLVMENSRECYHCGVRHPELVRTFLDDYDHEDPEQSAAVAAYWQKCERLGLPSRPHKSEQFSIIRLPFTKGAVSTTMDGKPAVGRLLGKVGDGDIGSVRWVHYPSTFNHALGDYAFSFRLLPLGPQETLVTGKWYVHRDAVEGRDYDLANLVKVWDVTNGQDRDLVERNQEGVNSLGYRPGPYSRKAEMGVIRFVDWYCAMMEEHCAGGQGAASGVVRLRRGAAR
jgi:Rieske 2Fe-2S family protein